MTRLLLTFALLLTVGCKPMGKGAVTYSANPLETPQTYFSTMNTLQVEVAYEAGAEPFVGNSLGQPLWDFLKSNIEALFSGRTHMPQVFVPTTLAEMKKLPNLDKRTWNAQDIYDLGMSHKQGTSTLNESYFLILFLNGYYQKYNGSADPQILGVQITDSPLIAIFKPVVTSTSAGEPPLVAKYIEQSTLVHEMGHALGLVNNGTPMTSRHQDEDHEAHCSNTSCTMYWQNEGGSAARDFVLKYIMTGNEVIFGRECLRDTRGYKP